MIKIVPFQAVRPTSDKVSLVTTRSYDEYSAVELASWLDFNPFSFLHIINPAYVNQEKISPDKRFKIVETKYADFKDKGIFIKDTETAFFVYEIQTPKHTFTGIVAGISLENYQNNVIKKHESTLDYRVQKLKNYFKITQFNTEPVLIMYKENPTLQQWIQDIKQNTPTLYDFSTTNRERHILWKIDTPEQIDYLRKIFENTDTLYIADGHHRLATSQLLLAEEGDQASHAMHYCMSYLICETNIKINEYNRLVHDLNGFSTIEFLEMLSEHFVVERVHDFWKPTQKHSFGMYINGAFYHLKLKDIPNKNAPILNQLDAQILYDLVLSPILGIEDLRTDSRISYIPGNQGLVELKKSIDEEDYKVGFILYPPTVEQIKQLADAQKIMPPKSTYIEPKFRNGLLIYEF